MENAQEERILQIEREIEDLKARNVRVDENKAWETSFVWRIFLLLFTYVLTAVVFWAIGVRNFALNALIPALGYYLSTLSIPFLRNSWEKRRAFRSEDSERF